MSCIIHSITVIITDSHVINHSLTWNHGFPHQVFQTQVTIHQTHECDLSNGDSITLTRHCSLENIFLCHKMSQLLSCQLCHTYSRKLRIHTHLILRPSRDRYHI
jgi:hypothetical protein